jgi:hypothetical protein
MLFISPLQSIRLTAGYDANKLDPIAFRDLALGPFALMKRNGVVFDENAVRLEPVMSRELANSR